MLPSVQRLVERVLRGAAGAIVRRAAVSMEDPVAARDELARLAKRGGLRHVNILASRASPPVYDDAWEPFWALAEEVDIPIGFHLAVS